jgi:hypothetical protein
MTPHYREPLAFLDHSFAVACLTGVLVSKALAFLVGKPFDWLYSLLDDNFDDAGMTSQVFDSLMWLAALPAFLLWGFPDRD